MIDDTVNSAHPSNLVEIDNLNDEAWRLRVTDSIRAYELSEKVLRDSEAMAYDKGKAEALRTFGFIHIRLAKYDEALALLKQGNEMFLISGDVRNQSIIHEYMGIIRRSQGDYAASLDELFKALALSRQYQFREEETLSLHHLSITYKYLGDMENALDHALLGLAIAKKIGEKVPESYHLNCIGGVYNEMGRYDEALHYFQQGLALRQELGDKWGVAGSHDNIGNLYFQQKKYTEALASCMKSLEITQITGDLKGMGNTQFNTGKILAQLHKFEEAQDYLQQSLQVRNKISDKKGQAEIYCLLGSLFCDDAFPKANTELALTYLHQALEMAEDLKAKDIIYKVHLQLSKSYKRTGAFRQALLHYETSATIENEVNNEVIQKRILNLQITHRVSQSQKEAEISHLKNVELTNLVAEIKEQKEQLQLAIDQIKATQSQLIQSEKMASLGELTAGIAHEIQNPLNFVNNFSELNKELIEEMQAEMKEGNHVDALDISNDIKGNEQKINHHGQRASAIVKAMLLHSRSSSGEKEMTDINALCDEYLRLAYYGLRAKDSSFQCDYKLHLDSNLPKINVVSQDIGRVLLNLINNGFQACAERLALSKASGSLIAYAEKSKNNTAKYNPKLTVSTKTHEDKIEISIKDNGLGIPENIKAKIFQPFFTTKPTGEGTGLGLSLAFDIVKAHGGGLLVESEEAKGQPAELVGTTFKIQFPTITGT